MVQRLTNIEIIDNSRVKSVYAFQIYKKKVARVGDTVRVAVSKVGKGCSYKRSLVCFCLITCTGSWTNRISGEMIKGETQGILFDLNMSPMFTRIMSPVLIEANVTKKHTKIMSLASNIV
jgi:ribosomal protein L14